MPDNQFYEYLRILHNYFQKFEIFFSAISFWNICAKNFRNFLIFLKVFI